MEAQRGIITRARSSCWTQPAYKSTTVLVPAKHRAFLRARKKERKKERRRRTRTRSSPTHNGVDCLSRDRSGQYWKLTRDRGGCARPRERVAQWDQAASLSSLPPPVALSLSCPRLDETLGTRGPNDRLVLSLLPTQPLHSPLASLFRERFLRGSGSVCLRREIEREPSVIRLQDNGRGEK